MKPSCEGLTYGEIDELIRRRYPYDYWRIKKVWGESRYRFYGDLVAIGLNESNGDDFNDFVCAYNKAAKKHGGRMMRYKKR